MSRTKKLNKTCDDKMKERDIARNKNVQREERSGRRSCRRRRI